jgi:hypothetical protein
MSMSESVMAITGFMVWSISRASSSRGSVMEAAMSLAREAAKDRSRPFAADSQVQ